jgi:hypothetical protein
MRHFRTRGQPCRQCVNALSAVSVHTQTQRFKTFQKYPGIKSTHGWATGAYYTKDLFHFFLTPHHCSAQATALTINVFGGRMNHDVGTQAPAAFAAQVYKNSYQLPAIHYVHAPHRPTREYHQFRTAGLLGVSIKNKRVFGVTSPLPKRIHICQRHKGSLHTKLLHVLFKQCIGGTKYTA